jgi:hypothetical protein
VRSFTFSWLPLLVYAGLIFYLSSLPNPPQPFTFSSADKVLHIVEYVILGILIINLLKHYFPDQGNKQLISLAVVLSTLYGISPVPPLLPEAAWNNKPKLIPVSEEKIH